MFTLKPIQSYFEVKDREQKLHCNLILYKYICIYKQPETLMFRLQ